MHGKAATTAKSTRAPKPNKTKQNKTLLAGSREESTKSVFPNPPKTCLASPGNLGGPNLKSSFGNFRALSVALKTTVRESEIFSDARKI